MGKGPVRSQEIGGVPRENLMISWGFNHEMKYDWDFSKF